MSKPPAPASSDPGTQPIASLWHLLLVLLTLAVLGYWGQLQTAQLRASGHPDRVAFYLRTILSEWLVLALVLAGVRFNGSSLRTVLGDRWPGAREALRDLGIGLLFLVLTMVMVMILGPLAGMGRGNGDVRFLFPQGPWESALWVGVSFSAGVCEEALFRGYLQRQFISLARNLPAGLLGSALAFGAAHLYQGWGRASVIFVGALMSGLLAYKRKTVRPGMFAHFFQDLLPLWIRH